MTIDTVITFDPEDFSEEMWVGKSYWHEDIKYVCNETLDDGKKIRNFIEIDGKLYLASELVLINKSEGMKSKSGKKMK